MAEGRTRKTGQHDQQLIRALAEATEAKRAVAELTKRLEALEAEMALLRGQLSAIPRGSAPNPAVGSPPREPGKRVVPPPLPASHAATPGPVRRQSKGYIDISEMAELVNESIPPPRRK